MNPLGIGPDRSEVLKSVTDQILEVWSSFDSPRDSEPEISAELHSWLSAKLPVTSTDAKLVIEQAFEIMDASTAQSRPRFFAYIGSSGLEMGAIADFIVSTYDVNQAIDARAASRMDEQTIRWISEFIGYPHQQGVFTSGGMVSNLTALAAARTRALPDSRRDGITKPVAIYSSAESHYSNTRAVEVLGMGSKSIRAIEIDESHRMKPSALRAQIELDINNGITPIAIIATAGTTLTGAIDPLDEIATIAEEFGIWLHIDGAYGIPAAGTSRSTLFKGIERADSITIDAHKWLFVPKACSLLLIRDLNLLAETFSHHEAYMPHVEMKHNPVDLTLEYSRPLRSLKLWLGFKTHGADAFRQAIEANLELATLTYDIATRRGNYRLLPTPPQLSIVPLQYVPSTNVNISEFNAMLCNRIIEDGRFYISPAQIDGETWLRPCYTNFRTTTHDVEEFFNVIEEIAATISL